MHPRIYHVLAAVCVMLWLGSLIESQIAHAAPLTGFDCRTILSGHWNAPATWENCGGGVPGADDAAFIQAGHTVTLTQNEAVGDLHISTGTTDASFGGDGKVGLGEYVLELNGKLRSYFAALGTTPGTSSDVPPTQALTMTPASAGRLRVVGSSRFLTYAGEWAANATANTSLFHIEIAAPDATIIVSAPIKAGDWTLVSGVLDVNDFRIPVDRGTTVAGNVTIGAAATLISGASGTAGNAVVSRTTSAAGGALTVNGRLVLKGNNPYIAMTTISLAGAVEYAGANQTLARATSGGASPNVYGTLVLTNTGAKTLGAVTTVTTRLVLGGISSLTLGSNTLTYGSSAAIEYAGTAAQITGPELPAAIDSLVIANSAGVTLSASTAVSTLLDLLTGDLTTGANTLDLGSNATCSGVGDVVGAIRRSTVTDGVSYCFGHPDVRAGIQSGSTPPSALTMTLAKGSAPFAGAVTRQYTVTAPGFAGVANLRLHYRTDELNGNTPASLHLWRYDGVRWLAQAPSSRGGGYVEKQDVTAFSAWALGEDEGSTAADLSAFTALAGGDHVRLTWATGSEVDLAGFHLYRAASADGAQQRITATLIPARFTGQVAGAAYAWADHTAALDGSAQFYWLEAVSLQDASNWYGPVEIAVARLYLPVVGR